MNLLCLSCSKEMSRTEVPRITFNCGPCRETIQFFDVRAEEDRTKRFFGPSVAARYFTDATADGVKSVTSLQSCA
jgi:hypothetical protein